MIDRKGSGGQGMAALGVPFSVSWHMEAHALVQRLLVGLRRLKDCQALWENSVI